MEPSPRAMEAAMGSRHAGALGQEQSAA